jgi:transcription initiation factor IIE alpha subunit
MPKSGGYTNTDRIIALLKRQQNLDKFEISKRLKIEITETQTILDELKKNDRLVSGLQKDEGSSNYTRRYFLLF